MIADNFIKSISAELKWLEKLVEYRVGAFHDPNLEFDLIPFDDFSNHDDIYANIIKHYQFNDIERGILIIAFANYFYNQIFDPIVDLKLKYPNRTQVGGLLVNQTEFSPNLEFVCFLLTKETLSERIECYDIFKGNSSLLKFFIIEFDSRNQSGSIWHKTFTISYDYSQLILTGSVSKPDFSSDFPAKLLTTNSSWGDLVLP